MKTACLILAAGKGTRMKSALPKVLYPVCGIEMINLVVETVKKGGVKDVSVVLGHSRNKVTSCIDVKIKVCVQKTQGGTAHAVLSAKSYWKKFPNILIVYGDHPLLCASTVRKILRKHRKKGADLTLLSTALSQPGDYGRLIRDKKGSLKAIVEKKDLTTFQVSLKDTNPGVMCFKTSALLKFLPKIKLNKKKKEYYLTDIVAMLYNAGKRVEEVKSSVPEEEGLGVNSFNDLIKAQEIMRTRIITGLISNGVKVFWPQSVYIEAGVKVDKDTRIFPFTIIDRDVKIGRNCTIGPFAHIRRGTRIKDNADIGNFAEIKNSYIDVFTKIKHFSYIGDAVIGKDVNVGAGTVTANFDGKNKYKTVIKDGAFIGSDTVLIAPVRVGKGARTGAGSVVTRNRNVKDKETVAGVPAKPLRRK